MKIKTILAAGAAVLALSSCMDGDNEYHSTYFYPISNYGIETFADQSIDSVRVISYDSWSLSNNCEWFDVYENNRKAPFTVTVPNGYMASNRLDFHLQPNTTGKVRAHIVEVVSSFNKIGTIGQTLVQYPFHNIIWPNVSRSTTDQEVTYNFKLDYSAGAVEGDTIRNCVQFKVFGRNATLTTESDWLTPWETKGFEPDKVYRVKVSALKNNTDAERTGTLTLTSEVNGVKVSTPIKVVQAKPAK